MYGYIYKTTNLLNNKIYVGLHKGEKFDKNYYGSGKLITQAIKKYGRKHFKVELIDIADTPEELAEKEIFWVKKLKSTIEFNNYNILPGGDITQGLCGKLNGRYGKPFKHSEETKKKISNTIKQNYNSGLMTPYWTGKKLSKEHANSLDVTGKKWYTNGKTTIYLNPSDPIPDGFYPGRHQSLGHTLSEDARKKLSEKAKGRKLSEETKKKISEAQKGRKLDLSAEQHEIRSQNASKRNKGRHWYTNGRENRFINKLPTEDGWRRGYTLKAKMK